MNIEKLNELIELKGDNLAMMRDDIAELVIKYPYSGPFRMLLAKASKEAGHLDSRKDLLAAAAHCSSRKALFDVMFAESFVEQAKEIHEIIEAADEVSEDEVVALIWHPEDPTETENQLDPEEVKVREDVIEAIASTLEGENVIGEEKKLKKKSEEKNSQNFEDEEPQIRELGSANSVFGKWLSERAKATDFGELKKAEAQVERGATAIIDAFLKKSNPTIGEIRDVDSPVGEWARKGLAEDPSLVTETMAKLYAKQGQIGRARKAFKMLALKYPDKSVYFAAQLKKLSKN
jgi:hypothetical protein